MRENKYYIIKYEGLTIGTPYFIYFLMDLRKYRNRKIKEINIRFNQNIEPSQE